MRRTITGQRTQDFTRRTFVVAMSAAVLPTVATSAVAAGGGDASALVLATMASTCAAGAIVGVLLMRMTHRFERQAEHFDQERRRWREEACTDPLTGIANRRGAANEIARRRRRTTGGDEWTVVTFDVDRFKDVNDRHGHAVGDRVLVAVADVVRRRLPAGAIAARWGGDEFVVFALGGVGIPDGWAGSVALELERTGVPCREGDLHVSISYGEARGSAMAEFDEILADADLSLLGAKADLRATLDLAPGSSAQAASSGRSSGGRLLRLSSENASNVASVRNAS